MILAIGSAILGAFGGIKGLLGFGTSIASAIADAKIAVIHARTEEERIRANERVVALEIQSRVHGRWEGFVRFAFAVPFVTYTWKLILWDKVLKWGVTDPLSPTLEYLLFAIVGFYFLHSILQKAR